MADTSPLNYFILLGETEILARLYGRLKVPSAVMTELRHPQAPEDVRSWAGSPPEWLEIEEVKNLDSTLPLKLGCGEREAISLALELRANLLVIDERAGRELAEARHIRIAGTLALLLRAGILGLLDFHNALNRIQQSGFYVSPGLRASMMARYLSQRK